MDNLTMAFGAFNNHTNLFVRHYAVKGKKKYFEEFFFKSPQEMEKLASHFYYGREDKLVYDDHGLAKSIFYYEGVRHELVYAPFTPKAGQREIKTSQVALMGTPDKGIWVLDCVNDAVEVAMPEWAYARVKNSWPPNAQLMQPSSSLKWVFLGRQ